MKYYEELLRVQSETTWHTVKTGTYVMSYLSNSLQEIAMVIGSSQFPIQVQLAQKFIDLLNGFTITIPPSTQDAWQINFHETKYRTYTSIYWNCMGITGWWFRALSEMGNTYCENDFYFFNSNQHAYGVTPVTYFTLPNYNVVDMIAYNLRNSTPGYAHTETIEKYWLNDYTAIMSNIQ